MDDRHRNLRTMISEAKDTSELMVDLAYAALYFGDPDMADEVTELEERMSELIHDMRAVCIMAVRAPREAESMSSVLQVIGAIEGIANGAVDIARIVTHNLGIPRELVADLSMAEEVSHRVMVRDGSHMAHRPLAALELPVATGMRVMAIRRDRDWNIDVDGDDVLVPGDVLFLEGSPAGITRLRELANAPLWEPAAPPEDGTVDDSKDEGWMRDYVVTTKQKISAPTPSDTAEESAAVGEETADSTGTSANQEVIATAKTNRAANLRQTMGGKVLVQLKKVDMILLCRRKCMNNRM